MYVVEDMYKVSKYIITGCSRLSIWCFHTSFYKSERMFAWFDEQCIFIYNIIMNETILIVATSDCSEIQQCHC